MLDETRPVLRPLCLSFLFEIPPVCMTTPDLGPPMSRDSRIVLDVSMRKDSRCLCLRVCRSGNSCCVLKISTRERIELARARREPGYLTMLQSEDPCPSSTSSHSVSVLRSARASYSWPSFARDDFHQAPSLTERQSFKATRCSSFLWRRRM